jgi:hypothetical protein
VHILACCRDNFEVEMLLSRARGYKGEVELPRLSLAMELDQKEFVAHPAAQHVSARE